MKKIPPHLSKSQSLRYMSVSTCKSPGFWDNCLRFHFSVNPRAQSRIPKLRSLFFMLSEESLLYECLKEVKASYGPYISGNWKWLQVMFLVIQMDKGKPIFRTLLCLWKVMNIDIGFLRKCLNIINRKCNYSNLNTTKCFVFTCLQM